MFLGTAAGGPSMARVALPNRAINEAIVARHRHRARRVASLAKPSERGLVMSTEGKSLDPNRLTPEQAAKLLSAAAKVRVPVEQIAADLEIGAPRNPDGTINLVHYAAWLVKEMGRGE